MNKLFVLLGIAAPLAMLAGGEAMIPARGQGYVPAPGYRGYVPAPGYQGNQGGEMVRPADMIGNQGGNSTPGYRGGMRPEEGVGSSRDGRGPVSDMGPSRGEPRGREEMRPRDEQRQPGREGKRPKMVGSGVEM